MKPHPWRQYRKRRVSPMKGKGRRTREVAELMADGLDAAAIGAALGLNASYVRGIQAKIRKEIDDAQRAAGFGRWCV